jgi:hypothetical protein
VGINTLDEVDRGAELRLAISQTGSQDTADGRFADSNPRAASRIENPCTRICPSQLRNCRDTERVHRRDVLNSHRSSLLARSRGEKVFAFLM